MKRTSIQLLLLTFAVLGLASPTNSIPPSNSEDSRSNTSLPQDQHNKKHPIDEMIEELRRFLSILEVELENFNGTIAIPEDIWPSEDEKQQEAEKVQQLATSEPDGSSDGEFNITELLTPKSSPF